MLKQSTEVSSKNIETQNLFPLHIFAVQILLHVLPLFCGYFEHEAHTTGCYCPQNNH